MNTKLFKFEESKCSACGNHFLSSALEDGRCKSCIGAGLHAGFVEDQEFVKSEQAKREELKDIIRELLEEIKNEKVVEKADAAFKEKKCKNCGEMFMPRAAAAKYCDDCHADLK